jgi:beta-glucosidase
MAQHDVQAERGLLAALSLEEKVRLLTGLDNWRTQPLPVIGLDPIVISDGPAGVRGVALDERNPSGSLPCPSALGATWDPELVAEVAYTLGVEARSKGVSVLLAPTINTMRTPVGGRGFELFGEDPALISAIAVGYVTGLQRAGVAACVKHFTGNDSETGRWRYDVRVAEYVLRELYLAPFEAAVRQASAAMVMAGYNMVNGVTMTEHAFLLGQVLRGEWGFGGVIVSDWHATRSTVDTALAGLDLAMPGPFGPWGDELVKAVRAGDVAEDLIDAKVARILRLASTVGALEDAGPESPTGPNGGAPPTHPVLADPALLRQAAAASFTLLRNERAALPLDRAATRRLAVIGPNAVSPITQGGGSVVVNAVSVSTPADALAGAGVADVTVSPGCITWNRVPEPTQAAIRDPETGEAGVRVEFRSPDGALLAAEHRSATMFTWWDGLPEGIGWGGGGTIVLRTVYRADVTAAHLIGGGGVGAVTIRVDGIEVASGSTQVPADPVEAMVRPGEIRALVDLGAETAAEIAVELLPHDWPEGPVAIRLGVTVKPDEDALLASAVEAARQADAAVVVVGTGAAEESEGFDRPSLSLPGRQDELVRRVAAVCDRTVVVVNAGMPVLLPWSEEVQAVLLSWFGGQEYGAALADVLFGDSEPRGRLPVTMPRAEADCPVLHTAPAQDDTLEYAEGLLIGYRGYDRSGTEPHYPFGHGLGYTTWAYEEISAGSADLPADGDVDITVRIRNTGTRAGREVVQAYVEPPDDDPVRPVRTLAAFGSATAPPGEAVQVRLSLPRRAFGRFLEDAGEWAWPTGAFTIRVGRSSRDLRLTAVVTNPATPATSSTS